jgi:(hydroxyamino)benzene mutase
MSQSSEPLPMLIEQKSRLQRQGHRLCQLGIALVLLISVGGFFLQYLAAPSLGVSTHALGASEGIFVLAQGLLWPRLNLGRRVSQIAFISAVYASLAILTAYAFAATTGTGMETIALNGPAAGLVHGSAVQEDLVRWTAYSSAPPCIASLGLILWGLKTLPKADSAL